MGQSTRALKAFYQLGRYSLFCSIWSSYKTDYELDDRGFESWQRLRIFPFTTFSPALGPTQPPIQRLTGALSLGVKLPGCEVDHSLPSCSEIRNAWGYTSTLPYVFTSWYSVKHRLNLTFPFT